MGIYDKVEFDEGLNIELPGFDGDLSEVEWQTKTLQGHPLLETYRVSEDGRLLKEDVKHEEVSEEEADTPEVLSDFPQKRRVHLGWSDIEYHGEFEFHAIVDEEYLSFEAKFTDGELVEITRSE